MEAYIFLKSINSIVMKIVLPNEKMKTLNILLPRVGIETKTIAQWQYYAAAPRQPSKKYLLKQYLH